MTTIPCAVSNILKISKKYDKDVMIAINILTVWWRQIYPRKSRNFRYFSHLSQGVSGIVLASKVAIGSNPVSSTALIKY